MTGEPGDPGFAGLSPYLAAGEAVAVAAAAELGLPVSLLMFRPGHSKAIAGTGDGGGDGRSSTGDDRVRI